MSYRVVMSMGIEAHSDQEAMQLARKLKELLKSPMVRMALETEGIRPSGDDGNPVVHQPFRE